MTRGIRNNNPLNIRRTADKWKGMAAEQTDKAFVQFTDRKYGYRAAFIIIRNYIKAGRNTIGGIIRRWAPAADGNDVHAYIKYVCDTTDMKSYSPISKDDKDALINIVRSMAQIESGIIEELSTLEEAYEMAMSN